MIDVIGATDECRYETAEVDERDMSANSVYGADARAWAREVVQMAERGDWSRATKAATYALDKGIEHALLLQVRAIGRERVGDLSGAVADLERGLAVEPGHAGLMNALAICLQRSGAENRAIEVLSEAAAVHPDVADTFFNLGAAQLATGDIAGAIVSLQRLLTLEPDHSAGLGKLALLSAHTGDAAAARGYAERALQQDASDSTALLVLSELDVKEGSSWAAETRLRTWLAGTPLDLDTRHRALGLLGDALEGQGRYAEAFPAYQSSNAAFRALHVGRFAAFERSPLRSKLHSLGEAFSALPTSAWTAGKSRTMDGDEPGTHVFLMGFMRSGTTLLEQVLSSCPHVETLEEIEAMAQAGADLLTAERLSAVADLDEEALSRFRQAYWRTVRAKGAKPSRKVFIDKLPFNGAKLPLIARLFPEAKIIFALRDPRDVVLSCFQRRLKPNAWAYELSSLEDGAQLYSAYMDLVRRYRANLTLSIYEHRHEQFVVDFKSSLAAVCDYIGIDPDESMSDFAGRTRSGLVVSQTAQQLQSGLSTQGLERWRFYADRLQPVAPVLQPWIDYFRYASPDQAPAAAVRA